MGPPVNLTLLRQRNFGLLWWAGMISITGDWVLWIALPIYVLGLTGSPAAVSGVVLAGLLGTLLVGNAAGAYVDRWDRRRVLVAVNALQAVALLPLLAVDSPGRVWIVVMVAFVESALAKFVGPAENALLPRLVPTEHLVAANALNSLNNNIGRLVGLALGGVIAAVVGLGGAALVDAGTFAVAAGLSALITGRHRADGGIERRHLLRELADGLRAIARNRIARAIVIFATLTAVGEGMMSTLFAVFVTRALDAGGREMGWLMSAQAVGGILGSLAGARVARRFRPVALASTCMVLFGLIDLAIFNYPRWSVLLWPVVVMFFLVGLPAGVAYAVVMTLFQVQTPDRLRGRVFAVLMVGQAVFGMVGTVVAGALGQTVSVVTLLTVQGAGYVVAAVLLRLLAGRGPDSLAEPAPVTHDHPLHHQPAARQPTPEETLRA